MVSVVIKPFQGGQRPFVAGDLVDSSGWRNEKSMLSEGVRMLRAATKDEIKQFDAGVTNIFGKAKPARPAKRAAVAAPTAKASAGKPKPKAAKAKKKKTTSARTRATTSSTSGASAPV